MRTGNVGYVSLGSLPFDQKVQKYQNGDKWHGNFLAKFEKYPEIAEFAISKPYN